MPDKELHPDAIGKADASTAGAPQAPQGDGAQDALGFGHRAHSPDPGASYGFDPGKPRMLPRDQKKRWKVPG